ncbi:DUF2254 domain-containing protein [Dyadobacter sp. 3J3]|uniref:DUF2254 domain-containing protein n=1 Tax=Dyadobacter sp. 3J3 TaxID=2606600 RepID=UPI001358951A|nr:DUF2254 family protein [Dyadobacter sp. 3J3]
MLKNFIRKQYQKTISSIAFFPAIIAFGFLVLCGIMISLDYSEQGKFIKSQLHWLRLKDASTARSIIGAIASGIISLTVFSFSMVMIVLNQGASQMSNRVLGQLIGNKFQQIVLGIYIGTIIYAFFLLSTIRDIDSGLYIPALSTYLLIFFTIFDIFIFIYFLHYITQSVKYEVVIKRIYNDTLDSLKKVCTNEKPSPSVLLNTPYTIDSSSSGVFEEIDILAIRSLCVQHEVEVSILVVQGTFVLKGIPLIAVSKILEKSVQKKLIDLISVSHDETIDRNFLYGFNQLREIALRALSPGINDPGTAIISLHALASLIQYRSKHFPENVIRSDEGKILGSIPDLSFEAIVSSAINPILDYGKNDRLLCEELILMCRQLKIFTSNVLFDEMILKIKSLA